MKLVFEFAKTGNMIYVSHLDLSRLFLRVLRMAGLRPAYSHGFNPHPKMSFALPLSLGLHSVCELLEFEIDTLETSGISEGKSEIISKKVIIANDRLPDGVRIRAWFEKPAGVTKSLASLAMAATYEFMCDGLADAPGKLETFFGHDRVLAAKRDKKTGGEKEVDIRPLMHGYRIVKDMRGRMLAEATLASAPSGTLNPQVFFGAFCEASGLIDKGLSPVITRTAILSADGKPLREGLR